MKAPRNTTEETNSDPIGFLGLAMIMGSSAAIEHQEKSGQSDFVHSDTLPTDGREELEKIGIVFGDQVPGDKLFTFCTLPKGWKKVPTSHSMWSDLLDANRRKRAAIFYKAAFYDRSAHAQVNRRFSIARDYEREDAAVYQITDGGNVIHTLDAVPYSTEENRWEVQDVAARQLARMWIDEHYPDWQNPGAYWDLTVGIGDAMSEIDTFIAQLQAARLARMARWMQSLPRVPEDVDRQTEYAEDVPDAPVKPTPYWKAAVVAFGLVAWGFVFGWCVGRVGR